jgi:hypothetical protein
MKFRIKEVYDHNNGCKYYAQVKKKFFPWWYTIDSNGEAHLFEIATLHGYSFNDVQRRIQKFKSKTRKKVEYKYID